MLSLSGVLNSSGKFPGGTAEREGRVATSLQCLCHELEKRQHWPVTLVLKNKDLKGGMALLQHERQVFCPEAGGGGSLALLTHPAGT